MGVNISCGHCRRYLDTADYVFDVDCEEIFVCDYCGKKTRVIMCSKAINEGSEL